MILDTLAVISDLRFSIICNVTNHYDISNDIRATGPHLLRREGLIFRRLWKEKRKKDRIPEGRFPSVVENIFAL